MPPKERKKTQSSILFKPHNSHASKSVKYKSTLLSVKSIAVALAVAEVGDTYLDIKLTNSENEPSDAELFLSGKMFLFSIKDYYPPESQFTIKIVVTRCAARVIAGPPVLDELPAAL
ncbi:hypothetical protein EPUL_001270 [Erysiphe pulchra]|uniref:Uncharacterized protein n=1 Tax=Erysiphe pulchra TaxID=225359 RepID=A0A2S4PYC6_9PEZI|nr:hypothetical protein EPUL_001270 [Erysiphe pulchra]